jgi:DNA-binding transcriptional MerR regulator
MIPNKSSFKFQELTPITGVKPYVIRYWETEFPEIDPVTSDSGQKIYARKDVEAILKIKKLLFEDRLSIPEAKLMMSSPVAETVQDSHHTTEVKVSVSQDHRPHLEEALALIRDIKSKRNW